MRISSGVDKKNTLSHQNVPFYLPHRATFVPHLLEPWTATTLVTIAAVAIAFKASHSLASLIRPLELEYGRRHQFALLKVVAVKVSSRKVANCSSTLYCHRNCHLTKLPW